MPPFLGNELLRGELVYLARPQKDELRVIAGWSNDMEYSRSLRRGLVYPDTGEDYDEWWSDLFKHESGYPFAIHRFADQRSDDQRSDDSTLIGFVLLTDIFWQARRCSVIIGIDPSQRGRGYGTDALRVALKYAFLEMNLFRVGLEVMMYNEAGLRAYTKVGFVPEGRLRALVYRDGVYYDVQPMSILRPEWEARYNQPPVSYPAADAAPE